MNGTWQAVAPRARGAIFGTALLFATQLGFAQPELTPPGPPPNALPPAVDVPPPPVAEEEAGIETLTQGPLHEAFANPSDLNPTPGQIIERQPPADVPEQPPEYAPEGDSAWIPGYWMWDDDRDDFLWVTGVWREVPPGMRWVPGYWTQLDNGWQRVAGFWASNQVAEVEYRLTAPPTTLETGPSSPAPSDDHFWIPGSWVYANSGYAWQGGYWAPFQPNWVWVPARWAWTPAGFVYLPGFWDYRLPYRGQIFAPVAFRSPLYTQPNWVYRPTYVIPTNNLFIHLWIRPQWGSYYFGNYYGPQFVARGFTPWCNVAVASRHRYCYDPLFTYANHHYRREGVDFVGRVQGWHRYYDEHTDARPARTWHEQQQFLASHPKNQHHQQTQLVARTLTDAARSNDSPVHLKKLDSQAMHRQVAHADQLKELHVERKKLEREANPIKLNEPTIGQPALDRIEKGEKNIAGKAKADNRDDDKSGQIARDGARREPSDNPRGGHVTKLKLPQTEMLASSANALPGQPAGNEKIVTKKVPPPKPNAEQHITKNRLPNNPSSSAIDPPNVNPAGKSNPSTVLRNKGADNSKVGHAADLDNNTTNPLNQPGRVGRTPSAGLLDQVERGTKLPQGDQSKTIREFPRAKTVDTNSSSPQADGSQHSHELPRNAAPGLPLLPGTEPTTGQGSPKGNKGVNRAGVQVDNNSPKTNFKRPPVNTDPPKTGGSRTEGKRSNASPGRERNDAPPRGGDQPSNNAKSNNKNKGKDRDKD